MSEKPAVVGAQTLLSSTPYQGGYPTQYIPATSFPFSAAPAGFAAAPVIDNEGDAPEGTPLSAALCARLGVPQGTIWGLPAGQRRDESAAPAAPAAPAQPASGTKPINFGGAI